MWYAVQLESMRQAKEAAVKSCSDQKNEIESLTAELNGTKQKLTSVKVQLQV